MHLRTNCLQGLVKHRLLGPLLGPDAVGLMVLEREPFLMDKFPGEAAVAAQGATL